MNPVDIASLFLRAALGITMLAHGWNHAFGGGRLPGTARWFESIGIRPGSVHALLATTTEIGSGFLIAVGLFTPLAAAGVVGTMLVALVANHWRNGFFIFRPGEGYEYVLFLVLSGFAMGSLGGGRISLDHALVGHLDGWLAGGKGLAITGTGAIGALLLLGLCWRPNPSSSPVR